MHLTLMSNNELRTAGTISRLLKGDLTNRAAAQMIGVTIRTIRRMKSKVRKGGTSALAHALRGKPGNRRMDDRERKKIEVLLAEKYPDFGPTFAAEKLFEKHGIDRDPKTVRAAMLSLGLLKSRPRKTDAHREWRLRRAMVGELVQYDGSCHAWLEDRWTGMNGSRELCLLLAIDDATGRAMQACFAPHEGLLPTLGFWRTCVLKHGVPVSTCVDRFSAYKMRMKVAAENADTLTQSGRVTRNNGIQTIAAHSPQAKGRVERVFGTLQDRLVKEFRLAGVTTPEEGNAFLEGGFPPKFNARFSVPAREKGNAHRIPSAKGMESIAAPFCREDHRTVCGDSTVSHRAVRYQLLTTPRLHVMPKDKAVVRTAPDGEIDIFIRGKRANMRVIDKGAIQNANRLQFKKRTFLIPGRADISNSR